MQSLSCWGKDIFSTVLKNELQALAVSALPLEMATSQAGYIDDSPVSVTVNRFSESELSIEGSVGIFFTEIVINCGCGDDPMLINGYGKFQVVIDKKTAATTFSLLTE